MVAITRSIGESVRSGDVFFEVVKIEGNKVELEVLSTHPIYIPYRPCPRPMYLCHPEIGDIENATTSTNSFQEEQE